MQLLTLWFFAYMLPAFVAWMSAYFLTRKNQKRRGVLIGHVALLFSIAMSQYVLYLSIVDFPWHVTLSSVGALALGALVTSGVLGLKGLWYVISAFIQEAAMLSIAFLLIPFFPFYIIVLLVVVPFVLSHFVSFTGAGWSVRFVLLLLWGVISLLLFIATSDIYLITAIHAVLGAIFVSKRFLSHKIFTEWLQ